MKKILLLLLIPICLQAQNYFNPLPIVHTKNLILRNCSELDTKDLFAVHGDPEVIKYTPMEPDKNEEKTLYWIRWRLDRQSKNLPAPWAIEHKESKKVIGLCGFYTFDDKNHCASLLVTFNRRYDYNFILEALDGAIGHGFTTMNLNRIDFYIDPKQNNAIQLCEQYKRKGLIEVGIIPDCLFYKDSFHDRILYCILKKDFMMAIAQ